MKSAGFVIATVVVLFAGCVGQRVITEGELPGTPVGGRWEIVTIGAPGSACIGKNGLAVDDSGAAHVAWRSGTSLVYACVRDDRWTTEVVESSGCLERLTGFVPDLALDGDGRPVIIYGKRGIMRRKLVRRARKTADGKWECRTIAGKVNPGRYTAVAVDGDGRVHAAYLDYKNRDDLYYAVSRDDEWEIANVDFEANAGFYCDLAVDAAGRPHVAYATVLGAYKGIDFDSDDYVVDDLKYATFDGDRWHLDTIDGYGNVGMWPSIRLDDRGVPHVSYAGEHRIKYAARLHGAWTIRVVDEGDDVGTATSLALDADRRPWIAYDRGRELRLAHWNGREWIREVVDPSGNVGPNCALDMDPAGTLHVVYTDRKHGNLKYARMRR